LPDAKNVWFAVVKPIIAKRENKALSSSDQPILSSRDSQEAAV
jgi:hypothetical protein